MLVGNILAVSWPEVFKTAALYGVIGLFHYAFRERFLAISLNHEAVAAQGVSVRFWDFLFYASFGFVVTSSVAGLKSEIMVGYAYAATKAAQLTAVRAIAREVAAAGVVMNVVAPGAIAALANSASQASGMMILSPGQSFSGLGESTCFFRAIPADGRLLRAEARGTINGRGLATAAIEVYDADGQLAASAQGLAQIIDSSKRQRTTVGEVKRILATLLFTDIVGSTTLVEALGDEAWTNLLRWHDETLRSLFAAHSGDEVDSTGDGFFVGFDSPEAALACAVAIQRALTEHRRAHGFAPQVRIGVHAAEATRRAQDYGGGEVHKAARIAALAEGADVVVLDDGFSHLRLRRELDILLLDALNPFGYGRLLPRGLLREPLPGLGRADHPVLDAILKGLIERDLSAAELTAEGYDTATVDRVWRLLEAAEYKRRQAPPGVKITGRAFGKDRRLPITQTWSG